MSPTWVQWAGPLLGTFVSVLCSLAPLLPSMLHVELHFGPWQSTFHEYQFEVFHSSLADHAPSSVFNFFRVMAEIS
jgi:hypothetical protein